ncbi:mediator of RNA polymerase II transcription subunit 19 [Podospora fimiseda]|uniref:Mediator of RNA polymerase II transcription subunit 19 n=1 Tax=Podospora fimiseda TaxID=252190 RepID=A0AAN7H3B4_9PEZI|nr:mediator of RNA polymerase II transcription subunit 19 [Podospora fimiseda]
MSFHPQTPQSPSQLSPGTSDLMMSQTGSMASTNTTLPTPAHSVNGSSNPSDMSQDILMGADSPHKRKRALEDLGDREQKKVQIEDGRLGIDDLHLDVGEKYLLCRTPHPAPRPNVAEDLFEKYGLTQIAAEVARVLPNGQKNALRKTYKGQIKKLGIQGHFDSVPSDPMQRGSLLDIARAPLDAFEAHYVRGKEINLGFTSDVQAKLSRAMTMGKGIVPKSVWDSSILGDLGSLKSDKQTPSARPSAPNTPLTMSGMQPRVKVGTPIPGPDVVRAKRSVKKRSYGDSSYEGYGEGYLDDDMGYSTGEGDMASVQKRRKKVLIDGYDPV